MKDLLGARDHQNMESTNMNNECMVPASKERNKHVNRKLQTVMGTMIKVHMGSRGTQKKGYPIPWEAEDENLSAKVLKFKLSLKGHIKFWGQTIWGRTEGTLCTRSGSLTGWCF